ncbi:hypothetical protein GCM10018782_05900 [Streptomyces griseoaurantiacus]|nr:hypothetical protein GCM10018782_05900 [Streptomyces griseoaurantiacus]
MPCGSVTSIEVEIVTGSEPVHIAFTVPVQATAVSGCGASSEKEGAPVTLAPVQLHVVGVPAAALLTPTKLASPSGIVEAATGDDASSEVVEPAARAEGTHIISAAASAATNVTTDLIVNFTIPPLVASPC